MSILQVFKTFSNPKTVSLYLKAMPIRKYKTIDGWLSLNEAYNLYAGAKSLPDNSIVVEIGSWKGKSTYCLAKGLHNGTVYAIDPFNSAGEEGSAQVYQEKANNEELLNVFKSNMASRGMQQKVVPWKGYSQDFINKIDKINFLFIDGDHSVEGALYDFDHYSPKIVKGGMIAFHDYDAKRPAFGPTWVIENKVKTSGSFEQVGIFDTLWLGRKVN